MKFEGLSFFSENAFDKYYPVEPSQSLQSHLDSSSSCKSSLLARSVPLDEIGSRCAGAHGLPCAKAPNEECPAVQGGTLADTPEPKFITHRSRQKGRTAEGALRVSAQGYGGREYMGKGGMRAEKKEGLLL